MPGPFLGFHNVDEATVAVDDAFSRAPGIDTRPSDVNPLRAFSDMGTVLARKTLTVRKPCGMTVSWNPTEPVPADHTIVDGDHDGSHVAELARIDHEAYQLRPVPYRTGRRLLVDGEIITEVADDFAVWNPVPQ